jgi:hypothetical protein
MCHNNILVNKTKKLSFSFARIRRRRKNKKTTHLTLNDASKYTMRTAASAIHVSSSHLSVRSTLNKTITCNECLLTSMLKRDEVHVQN